MTLAHAHESSQHQELKQQVGNWLKTLGWVVAYEEKLADVAAIDPAIGLTIAVEIERSARNCVENVLRDHRHGCQLIIIIAVGQQVAKQIRGRLERELPEAICQTIHLLHGEALSPECLEEVLITTHNQANMENPHGYSTTRPG